MYFTQTQRNAPLSIHWRGWSVIFACREVLVREIPPDVPMSLGRRMFFEGADLVLRLPFRGVLALQSKS